MTHSYVSSRFYLHDPPEGDDDASMPHPEIPLEALRKEQELADAEPDVNPWACIVLLAITVALMGVTAEFVRLSASLYSLIASPPTQPTPTRDQL
jgi:Ca2+:H+ antiporter